MGLNSKVQDSLYTLTKYGGIWTLSFNLHITWGKTSKTFRSESSPTAFLTRYPKFEISVGRFLFEDVLSASDKWEPNIVLQRDERQYARLISFCL